MRLVVFAALVLSMTACQSLDDPQAFAGLDRAFFDCKVQRVVTKTCSGFACHGTTERYYTVFAPGRLRFGIAAEKDRKEVQNGSERQYNYLASIAFVDVNNPEESLFLTKPLEESAGGSFHRGAEIFGKGDVFKDKQDRDYMVLVDWVNGAKEAPDCKEAGL